jgi:peptidyl-prolyl cis-trans isomerase SurA
MIRALLIAAATLACLLPPVSAQTNLRVERIVHVVAIVGDSAVTNIDLETSVRQYLSNPQVKQPADSAEFEEVRRDVLEAMIDQLLVLQMAARDTTVEVTEEEVDAAVGRIMDQLIQQFGGEAGLMTALTQANMSMQALRDQHRQRQRQELTKQKFLSKLRGERKPPPVTEEEIKKYFEDNRATIGVRPPTISYRQIVVPTSASDSAFAVLRAKADTLVQRARSGEDRFEQLAERFSADSASREIGGDLGFRRIGDLVPEFERAIFGNVRPGEIIGPVRTVFGLHVIKLEKIRGSERQARHILLRPDLTDADRERARLLADSLAEKMRAGANIDSLALRYSESGVPARVGPEIRDSLPDAYRQATATAEVGQVIGPFRLDTPDQITRWVVLRITDVQAERPATVDDFREQIEQVLAQGKLQEELIQELRGKTYIEVRLGDRGGGSRR